MHNRLIDESSNNEPIFLFTRNPHKKEADLPAGFDL